MYTAQNSNNILSKTWLVFTMLQLDKQSQAQKQY